MKESKIKLIVERFGKLSTKQETPPRPYCVRVVDNGKDVQLTHSATANVTAAAEFVAMVVKSFKPGSVSFSCPYVEAAYKKLVP